LANGIITIMIDILVIQPDDWQLWRALRRQALAESPAAFGSTLADWSGAGDKELRWRGRLHQVALNLVLTLDGEPVGMVSATAARKAADVELISLWVAPGARGRGVGDEAVRRVLAWARTEHPGSRLVLSVKRSNRPASLLYQRHGFIDAGPSPDDDDEVLMIHPGTPL
jgi:ribosomal protein S18 acetylase RimI-like enzyme